MKRKETLPATWTFDRYLPNVSDIFRDVDQLFDKPRSHNYPPYNLIKLGENQFKIEVAVAGFNKDELSVAVEENHLVIKGEKNQTDEQSHFIHRGLAFRNFKLKYKVASTPIEVTADLENGLLTVNVSIIEVDQNVRTITIN